jgi:hypothetical protein
MYTNGCPLYRYAGTPYANSSTVQGNCANDLVRKPYDPDALLVRMEALLAA